MRLRLRHVAVVNPSTPEFDLLPDTAEIPFLPLEAVWPGDRLDTTRRRHKEAVSTGYTRFREGDILVPKITPTFQADRTVIATGLEGHVGAGTTELHVVRVGPKADARYVRYLLSSKEFLDEGEASMIGVAGQKRVPDDRLRDLTVAIRDLDRQRAIADYLDAETARIDALIEKRQLLAELLEERLISCTSNIVSRGPVVKVRHLTSLITSGPRGWADYVADEGRPFIRSANLQRGSIDITLENLAYVAAPASAEAQRSSVKAGDVVVGITGANTGWVGLVPHTLAGGFVSQHVAVIRPNGGATSEWLANSLAANQAQEQLLGGQYGGTKQQLGLEDLANLQIHVPPLSEQRDRGRRLSQYRRWHAVIRETLAQHTGVIQERRQALITAAVTGDLQVLGAEA